MANEEQLAIIKQGTAAWNEWRLCNPDVVIDLHSAEHGGAKLGEANLHANEQRFRMLFEHAPLGILEVDVSQSAPVICAVNRRAEATYGWSSAELTALDPARLIPEESRFQIQRLVETVRAGKAGFLETMNLRRDGTVFPVRITATPATTERGLHMIVAVEDITAQRQRRSEAEAIDEERRRIAREIHDGVVQDLASLRLKLALWRDWALSDPHRIRSELDQAQVVLDAAIEEIRRSINSLRPVALDEVGLPVALRHYVADFNDQHDIYVDLKIGIAEDRIPARLELPIFRVVQEALNNVIQHAEASLVWVNLAEYDGNAITLAIRDNGRGFDLARLELIDRAGHLGLKQMRERVEQTGGNFTLCGRPGEGVQIHVHWPNLL